MAKLWENDLWQWDGSDVIPYTPGIATSPKEVRRGDTNLNGELGLDDALVILGSLHRGEGKIACDDAADVNADGAVDLTDALALLNFLYLGRQAPRGQASCEVQGTVVERCTEPEPDGHPVGMPQRSRGTAARRLAAKTLSHR